MKALPDNHPPIIPADAWEQARDAMLEKEKALTRAGDALAAERRRMPWRKVECDYAFETPKGDMDLSGLFDGRRQLIVYRAFYEPGVGGWPEQACVGCSLVADQVSNLSHLHARDTTLVFASRAPQDRIAGLKRRFGWEAIPWVTITDAFDRDFGADEWHAHNVFIRDDTGIYNTYRSEARGDEAFGTVWSYLDITPLGRQEEWEDSPAGYPQDKPYEWWRRNDAYGADAPRDLTD